jgi:hypothetical protein
LDGSLAVSFINGFTPATDDGFDVINTVAGVTGKFSTVALPALGAKQQWWNTTPGPKNLQLFVSPTLPRHNPKPGLARHDVNDDGFIVAGDALEIINYINAFGAGPLPASKTYLKPFLDVGGNNGEGDNFIAAIDALDVINIINAGITKVEGEGEMAPLLSTTDSASVAGAASRDLLSLLAYDLAEQARRRKN